MQEIERVTVTLPHSLVRDIDRREKNRSKFVAEAVRNELERRRREELRRSLRNPHAESLSTGESGPALSEQGFADWALGLPAEDVEGLVDSSAGRPVRWVAGEGWVEPQE